MSEAALRGLRKTPSSFDPTLSGDCTVIPASVLVEPAGGAAKRRARPSAGFCAAAFAIVLELSEVLMAEPSDAILVGVVEVEGVILLDSVDKALRFGMVTVG